jgi:pSer/pThr/pTyr-binding forkhead associated (FHA) protein
MSDQVLTILKYVVLAVLYLFFLRVLRAVWVELREPKVAAPPRPGPNLAEPSGAEPTAPPSPSMAIAPTIANRTMPARAGPPVLAVTDPPQRRGQRFSVNAETTVGRAPGCAVSLPDDNFVSQLHARIFRRDGSMWVEDLGSTNGTFVNGAKVSAPVPLQEGDRLQVGSTVLECTGS